MTVRLASEPGAVSIARDAIHDLERELDPALFENLRLLVSELVTNSIRHARSPAQASVDLRVELLPDRVRVEVGDRGLGFDPQARSPDHRGPSGWGLYFVDRLADRWGVRRKGGTLVWFEIDRS
jgi:anti-sigma regulatory factor (Ser/Thr protein kinase)